MSEDIKFCKEVCDEKYEHKITLSDDVKKIGDEIYIKKISPLKTVIAAIGIIIFFVSLLLSYTKSMDDLTRDNSDNKESIVSIGKHCDSLSHEINYSKRVYEILLNHGWR